MNVTTRPVPTDGTPTAEDWAAFLRPILAAVHNPPSVEDFRKRIAAIAFALPAVRRSMLTTATQREMVAKCKHWPTAAEVADFFADALRHEREVREYRARPMLTVQEPPPRTPEQIAHAKATAAETSAVLRGAASDADLPPVKPAYLSGEPLARVRDSNPLVRAARAMQQKAKQA
ncbi:MAG: hypothetical protein KGR68_09190 [Betaproteobacteria bacterium]|nr:hypothetical protein [Betaproteobacteria bacterium]